MLSAHLQRRTKTVFLDFIGLLGSGSFGSVLLARGEDKRLLVVKSINKELCDDEMMKRQILAEWEILQRNTGSPYLISGFYAFQTKACLCMAMEYFEGSTLLAYTERHLRMGTKIPEDVTRSVIAQVTEALHHLHVQNYIHRDVKLENVLISSACRVKLIDYGFVTRLTSFSELRLVVGTYTFMPLEALDPENNRVGVYSDFWSLGVLLYILATLKQPYEFLNNLTVMLIRMERIEYPAELGQDLTEVLKALLTIDPRQRLCKKHAMQKFKWFGDWDKALKFTCDVNLSLATVTPITAETDIFRETEVETTLLHHMMSYAFRKVDSNLAVPSKPTEHLDISLVADSTNQLALPKPILSRKHSPSSGRSQQSTASTGTPPPSRFRQLCDTLKARSDARAADHPPIQVSDKRSPAVSRFTPAAEYFNLVGRENVAQPQVRSRFWPNFQPDETTTVSRAPIVYSEEEEEEGPVLADEEEVKEEKKTRTLVILDTMVSQYVYEEAATKSNQQQATEKYRIQHKENVTETCEWYSMLDLRKAELNGHWLMKLYHADYDRQAVLREYRVMLALRDHRAFVNLKTGYDMGLNCCLIYRRFTAFASVQYMITCRKYIQKHDVELISTTEDESEEKAELQQQSEAFWMDVVAQLVEALEVMQARGIRHNNINSTNILVDTVTNHTKLCGFHKAEFVNQAEVNLEDRCSLYNVMREMVMLEKDVSITAGVELPAYLSAELRDLMAKLKDPNTCLKSLLDHPKLQRCKFPDEVGLKKKSLHDAKKAKLKTVSVNFGLR